MSLKSISTIKSTDDETNKEHSFVNSKYLKTIMSNIIINFKINRKQKLETLNFIWQLVLIMIKNYGQELLVYFKYLKLFLNLIFYNKSKYYLGKAMVKLAITKKGGD